MLKRLFILKLIGMLLSPMIAALKVEALKTKNPIDDAIVQIGELLVTMLAGGELDELFK